MLVCDGCVNLLRSLNLWFQPNHRGVHSLASLRQSLLDVLTRMQCDHNHASDLRTQFQYIIALVVNELSHVVEKKESLKPLALVVVELQTFNF